MSASGHFKYLNITFVSISCHFRLICNFSFCENLYIKMTTSGHFGCPKNHFWSNISHHSGPYATFTILIFFCKNGHQCPFWTCATCAFMAEIFVRFTLRATVTEIFATSCLVPFFTTRGTNFKFRHNRPPNDPHGSKLLSLSLYGRQLMSYKIGDLLTSKIDEWFNKIHLLIGHQYHPEEGAYQNRKLSSSRFWEKQLENPHKRPC